MGFPQKLHTDSFIINAECLIFRLETFCKMIPILHTHCLYIVFKGNDELISVEITYLDGPVAS